MRINVTKGSDPLGLTKYILDPKKQRDEDIKAGRSPILDTNLFGRDATGLAEEFRFSHDLNSRVIRTMTHYSISLAPGETVSDSEKVAISKGLLNHMGHQDCQYFIAVHHDREHKSGVQHWHICTSSIDLNGRWVPDHFNYAELKQAERDLELRHRLRYCPPKDKGEQRNLTNGERRQEERTGKPCAKRLLWGAIDQATEDHPSMAIMAARLKAKALTVHFYEFEDGGKGLSFGTDGKYFKGGDLGARYSFDGLQKYAGVSYISNQEDSLLRRLNEMSTEQCQAFLIQVNREHQEQAAKKSKARGLGR